MKAMTKRRKFILGGVGVVVVAMALVTVLQPGSWDATAPDWWSQTSYPSVLTVEVMSGANRDVKVEVKETPSTVQLTGWLRIRSRRLMYSEAAVGMPVTLLVNLKSPLGGREVVDQFGAPIPQHSS